MGVADLGSGKISGNQKQRKIYRKNPVAEHQQKMRNSRISGNSFNLRKYSHIVIVGDPISNYSMINFLINSLFFSYCFSQSVKKSLYPFDPLKKLNTKSVLINDGKFLIPK